MSYHTVTYYILVQLLILCKHSSHTTAYILLYLSSYALWLLSEKLVASLSTQSVFINTLKTKEKRTVLHIQYLSYLFP
jgi:hypothetical protein